MVRERDSSRLRSMLAYSRSGAEAGVCDCEAQEGLSYTVQQPGA